MSIAVSLEDFARRAEEFGSLAFLVTTDGANPHVVSATIAFDGTTFSVPAGRTSHWNIEASANATLLWLGRDGGPYSLIVDGDASNHGDSRALEPTRAAAETVR